jgi:hypothetical protein
MTPNVNFSPSFPQQTSTSFKGNMDAAVNVAVAFKKDRRVIDFPLDMIYLLSN